MDVLRNALDGKVDSYADLGNVLRELFLVTSDPAVVRACWLPTLSGGQWFPLAPRVEDVDPRNLTALSNGCRFAWHVRRFYSVAEHSIRVARLLESWGCPPDVVFEGFAHDWHESEFPNDVVSPVLRSTSLFGVLLRELSHRAKVVYRRRYGLPIEESEDVKRADLVLLATEKRDLLPPDPAPWRPLPDPLPEPIISWSPARARMEFWKEMARLAPDGAPACCREELIAVARQELASIDAVPTGISLEGVRLRVTGLEPNAITFDALVNGEAFPFALPADLRSVRRAAELLGEEVWAEVRFAGMGGLGEIADDTMRVRELLQAMAAEKDRDGVRAEIVGGRVLVITSSRGREHEGEVVQHVLRWAEEEFVGKQVHAAVAGAVALARVAESYRSRLAELAASDRAAADALAAVDAAHPETVARLSSLAAMRAE